MPVPFLILPKHNLILARPTGHVRNQCIYDYFVRVRAHPDYVLGLDRLIDNRHLDELDLDYAEMRNVRANETKRILAAPNPVSTAFVCPDGNGFGLARMYQSLTEISGDHDVGVFETYLEAMVFLGLDKSLADRIVAWQ